MAVRAETQIDLARVDDGSPGTPGQNGATFTPSVDAAGDISWTNDGGLPNPQTQNIMGPQGGPGTNGVSVTSVTPQYYLSTSSSSATGGSWSSTPQTFVSGRYYWTREYITYSNGTSGTSTAVYNAGMTKAAQDALDAKTIAGDSEQHFWFTSTGTDTGAHITEVTQDEWTDPNDPNYQSGGNLLARTNGIAIRDGMTELANFGSSGVIIGENANGKSRSEISITGMQVIQNVSGVDTQIANLGYGNSYYAGTETTSPYYTLGIRHNSFPAYDSTKRYCVGQTITNPSNKCAVCIKDTPNPAGAYDSTYWDSIYNSIGYYSVSEGIGSIAGNECSHAEGEARALGIYSHAEGHTQTLDSDGNKIYHPIALAAGSHVEGIETFASGSGSHAEGSSTKASGQAAHSEGLGTTASGTSAHSEGIATEASGNSSHAEGGYTHANGDYSHAQNYVTTAASDYQSAMGKYNAIDNTDTYALIIGNGTSANARSNALTVAWNGDVTASGEIKGKTVSEVPSITSITTGTLVEAYAVQNGKVVTLTLGVKKSTATAVNANVFTATLESKYRPKYLVNGVGYSGSSAGVLQLLNTGALNVHIVGAQLNANTNIYISATYVIE